MQLASRFASGSPVLRSRFPLSDDAIRTVAPSIFAEAAHDSRSDRYSYIPTAAVLSELRDEGFQPFMVCQTRVRRDDRREFTKHMIRLRHASQIEGREANEIILLNSHDGTSSYQMFGGMFRFVCSNGLVCGDTVADVRVPHKGNVAEQVIEGAYAVLQGFEQAQASRDAMQAITLDDGETEVFARAALALKYDAPDRPAPITEAQILPPPPPRCRCTRRFVVHTESYARKFDQGRSVRLHRQWPTPADPPRAGHRPKRATQSRLVAAGRWHAPTQGLMFPEGPSPLRFSGAYPRAVCVFPLLFSLYF